MGNLINKFYDIKKKKCDYRTDEHGDKK